MDAIMDGQAAGPIKARLTEIAQRRAVLTAELAAAEQSGRVATLDGARLTKQLVARVRDAKVLLARHTPQARQGLRKLLTWTLALTPIERNGQRGVRFTGPGTFGKILTGEAASLTVVPPG